MGVPTAEGRTEPRWRWTPQSRTPDHRCCWDGGCLGSLCQGHLAQQISIPVLMEGLCQPSLSHSSLEGPRPGEGSLLGARKLGKTQ